MKYDLRFKPRSVKDLKRLPDEFVRVQEELEDYEDLRQLREAKEQDKEAPTITLAELKKELGEE